jgi:3',5'-cyclic-AMP phosphodiesterase
MAFSFVQVTDHHLTSNETVLTRGFSTNYAFRTVLQHLAAHLGSQNGPGGIVPEFIVSTGDLSEVNPLEAYRAAPQLLGAQVGGIEAPGPIPVTIGGLVRMPMYFLPGNHDDLAGMVQHLFPGSAAAGPAEHEPDRLNVSFERNGVRFVCLDWGRDAKAVSTPGLFEFLSAALEDGYPAVILTHHHVAPIGVAWLDDFIADDIDRFWSIVRGKRVLGILAGHVHMTNETVVEGIPVMTLRSTAFQFARQDRPLLTLERPHYRLVTIDGDVLTSKVFEVAL